MPRKSPPQSDEKPQFERFIEAAKKAEAAETDEGLANAIRKVAAPKHPVRPSRRVAR
jgi:hypothetical protein